MTQPNNPALNEALQNSLAALKMIEGSFFEGSPEQRAIETALHSIEESADLRRETGGEADLIPWNHPLQIGAEDVVKRYNNYAQGHLPSDCNRELARLIAYFAQQQLSQLRAALDDGKGQSAVSILYQELTSLTQQLADAKGRLDKMTHRFEITLNELTETCTERDELRAIRDVSELGRVALRKALGIEAPMDWLELIKEVSLIATERDELKARLEEAEKERTALKFDLAEETKIVRRIWKQLGSPTYEELNGRSIYDLIDELKKERSDAVDKLCTTETQLARVNRVYADLLNDVRKL